MESRQLPPAHGHLTERRTTVRTSTPSFGDSGQSTDGAQAAPHHGTKSAPEVPPGAAAHNEARALTGLPIPDEVTAHQNNWRFCNYCFGLWWNGNPTNGACPSRNSPDGQHHGPGSWNFILPANPAEHI